MNARSIVNKIPDLHELVAKINPDIICITETWLHNEIDSFSLGLSSYSIFRKDRGDGNNPHGGVLLCVKPYLNPVVEVHSTSNEVLFVSLHVNGSPLKIIAAYRTPSMTQSENEDFVNFLRDKLIHQNNFVLVGDFNYPRIDWPNLSSDTYNSNIFLNFLNENHLYQKVSEPTRGENILDLCLSTDEDMVRDVEVFETFSTSDHNYFTCNIFASIHIEPPRVFPNFSCANWDMIRSYLSCVDWLELFRNCDCETMWTTLKNIIYNAVNLYVPLTVPTHKSNTPWSNNFIKRLIRNKKRKWRKFKNRSTVRNKREYNNFSKHVKKEIFSAKCTYEKGKFLDKNRSPKQFHSYMNRMTNSKNDSKIPPLQVNGEIFTNGPDKAHILASHYNSVFTVDNGNYPECQQYMPMNSFCTLNVTDENVLAAIRSMNPNGSPGQDNIYPQFIKSMSCYLILPLKLLFQKSIDSAVIPDDWRKGIIIPIYKNNNEPTDAASYRPICLTSVVCKLLERIIHSYFIQYLNFNNLISEMQHGFLKSKSTTTNLLQSLNDWTKSLDAKTPVDVIYIDLAKAFDSVSHPKLIHKLQKIGVGGTLLHWLSGFLSQREQSVRVQNYLSPPSPVTSGIGQGTILGPLLFILYVNDVTQCFSSVTNIQLYADDAKLYGSATEETCRVIQDDLSNACNYFSKWQLKINVNKCQVMCIGHNNPQSRYFIDNEPLPIETYCRDLGITFTNDLNVRKHCLRIIRNAYYKMKQFRISFSCKDENFQIYVYKVYIRPLLEYSPQIWSPHMITDIDKIENVQRFFTKRLPGLWNVPYMSRLQRLNIESLEVRRIYNDIVLFYKIVRGLIEVDFRNFFSLCENNTRGHMYKVNVQHARLNCRKFFFINRTIPKWNALPSELAEAQSLDAFKQMLKTFNLNMYCRGRAHTAE